MGLSLIKQPLSTNSSYEEDENSVRPEDPGIVEDNIIDPALKRRVEQGQKYVGDRVAKRHDGKICLGTVKKCSTSETIDGVAWLIEYDDEIVEYIDRSYGNEEDIDEDELRDLLEFYDDEGQFEESKCSG